uniref:Uncharacterized protein n=1 Tax=Parascaris univalens TaxID=6257 RepID=A0A915B6V9_PARUN
MFDYSFLLIILIIISVNDGKLFGRTLDKDTQLRIQGYCSWQCKGINGDEYCIERCLAICKRIPETCK